MKYLIISVCLSAACIIIPVTAMMDRVRIEKKLEELKEENTQLTAKVDNHILCKNAFLAGSFFTSMFLGLKFKTYKVTFIPPMLAFPAMLYTQHQVNLAKQRQEYISLPIRNLERVIKLYDNPEKT